MAVGKDALIKKMTKNEETIIDTEMRTSTRSQQCQHLANRQHLGWISAWSHCYFVHVSLKWCLHILKLMACYSHVFLFFQLFHVLSPFNTFCITVVFTFEFIIHRFKQEVSNLILKKSAPEDRYCPQQRRGVLQRLPWSPSQLRQPHVHDVCLDPSYVQRTACVRGWDGWVRTSTRRTSSVIRYLTVVCRIP